MNTGKKVLQAALKGLRKEWPKIATGLGAGLLAFGGYLVGREVPRYEEEIKRKEEEKGEKLTFKEKFPVAAKHFAGPAGMVVSGGAMVVAAAVENNKRIEVGGAAAALGEIATKKLAGYEEAAKELVGEEKAAEIYAKADAKATAEAAERLGLTPFDDIPPDISDEQEYECFDLAFTGLDGKSFYTSVNKIHAVENGLTSTILHGSDGTIITVGEAFQELGFSVGSIGDAFGWIFDSDKEHSMVQFNVRPMLKEGRVVLTINPEPVLVNPDYFPQVNYNKWR